MPRTVDHDERRRHIVGALLRIAGTQGLDAVSMREVAQEAGVSLGAVQHYFTSKDAMLLYGLEQWLSLDVHSAFGERIRVRVTREAAVTALTTLRAVAAEYLPHDDATRHEARVALAFQSRGAVAPALAAALVPAYAGFVGTLRGILQNSGRPLDVDVDAAARELAALLDGLRQPVLIGALPYPEALALVDGHLARLLDQRG